jgi:NodT family efflux transporter outer membrane factor (OMF) lipoprotein
LNKRSKKLLHIRIGGEERRRHRELHVFWFFLLDKNRFLPCLLAGCVAGCDLAPHYHVPLTKVPVAYKEAVAFTPAQPADRMPRGAWWMLFDDPTLSTLEGQMDSANPNLAAALASFQRARALAAEADAGLYPTLSVGGEVNYNRQSDHRPLRGRNQPNEYLNSTISAQASYEVDLWGEVANSIKAGREAAQAAAADLESIRLSLHAELAADYVALRGLDAQAAVLRNAVGAFGQALTLTQNRLAGDISSGIDVSRAQTQLSAAQAALTDVEEKRALEEHAVAVLVGRVPAALQIPPADGTLEQPDIAPGLPSTLLERRPDVAAAERAMAAANAEIGVARAAFYPALSLNLLYGFQNTAINPFSLPDELWSIGPGFVMPLFEGGLRNAEEAAAVAAYRLALGQYRQTVLTAFQEVEDALAQLRLLGQEFQQEQAAVAAAQRTLSMTTNLFKDGATNFLDVVIAQTSELQSEQALADLRTRRVEAAVALVRALGGGWTRQDLPGEKAVDRIASNGR